MIVQKAVELGADLDYTGRNKTCGCKPGREKGAKESGALERNCRKRSKAVRAQRNPESDKCDVL